MRHPKTLVSLALAGLCLSATMANAVEIKISTLLPNQSQWMQDMRAAGKVIEARTDGRVKLKFYGGGVQGTESAVLRKIRIGQLDGGTFAPTDFMKQNTAVNIYGLPFVFENWEEMRYVRDKMDPLLKAGFDELNYVTFGFVGSFSIVLSNVPISNHADMKGKKVWLPQGDTISYEAMKRLQLSPVALPVTDVLTGLQTGLLDIAAIPPEVAVALQWHTRVKYFTDMPVELTSSTAAGSAGQPRPLVLKPGSAETDIDAATITSDVEKAKARRSTAMYSKIKIHDDRERAFDADGDGML
ncbi:MAG: TRAP transporter substrate-binding protein DctP, partial [Woeseiaceae bacterium]|nr:TRAP transporter substrate-binding protein DctP [Woeseiaceae bacterium]